MSILHWIFVIALCTSFVYETKGQASCALSWDNGTALSDTDWSFGFALDTIEDVTPEGTVLLDMIATDITSVRSSTSSSSTSDYIFMQPALENGRFTLTITEYFTLYEEYETSTTLRMSIVFACSVNTRTLELAQPISDTNNNYPLFQNAPYIYNLPMPFPSGFSVQLFGDISARDIDLTNTLISFTLNSTDPNTDAFSISWLSQDTTDTKLHYAQLLTTSLLNFEQNVTFQIYATDNGVPPLTSETSVTIAVDEENSTPSNPVFNSPVYIADYSGLSIAEANSTLINFNQGNIGLSQGIDSTVEYTIEDNIGNYESHFGITKSEDYSYINIILEDVTEELLAEKYVILTLTATRNRATDPGVTILHIDLPGMISCSTTTESTDYPVTTVTQSSTECPTITTEMCICDSSTTTTTLDDSVITTTTPTDDSVTTTTTTATLTTPTDDSVTTTTTTATTTTPTDDSVATTTSTTPTDDSVATTTTTTATSTTPTDDSVITTTPTTTTTASITPSLSFSSSIYRFEKNSTFIGVLMTQPAVANNVEGTILYSVTFDNEDDLASRILIDPYTAALEVTATISPGIHTFQIIATIEDASLDASATVVLVISAMTDCSGDIVFGYALQIIELDEESVHENILPLDDNGCEYTIYSQTPNQDLLFINNNSLNTVAIDREASYFSEMSVAQVRLMIDANCPNETETKITRSRRDTEYRVLTENIVYQRTRTVLVVIIKDINDNAPIWNLGTPNYVGFPNSELSKLIHVPYVYQFSATDADIDENANVTYTFPSGSNEYFYIHESEGTLYIQQGVQIEDGFKLTIIATDGLFETPTQLTVRTLDSDNVVVLFITGGVIEDVDNIVEELSTSTGYWIGSLGSAVISESDTSSSRSLTSLSRITNANTLLRLVVYGLENDNPVTSETLISNLEDVEITWAIFNSVTLQSIITDNAEASKITVNTRGYMAAIIVLSLLLFSILIAAGITYYVFRRRQKSTSVESDVTYETFENRSSNESIGNHSIKSVTLNESHDHPMESTDSPNNDWTSKEIKESFYEANHTFNALKGGSDDDFVFVTPNEREADISVKREKKKSVAFKPTVEEIEIEVSKL